MAEALDSIAARVKGGEQLSDSDVAVLADTRDILTLGMLGDEARQRRHGSETTFVRVANVQVPLGAGGAGIVPPAAHEVRVAGPVADFDSLVRDVRRVVESAGARPVSAFELEGIEAFAVTSRRALPDLLAALRDAGVVAIASAAIDCLDSPESSLDAVKKAGLDLARFGVHHTAGTSNRLTHIVKARALQHSLGWIRSFAPLGQVWNSGSPSTGYDDVRQVALARLVIDNIESIQVDWSRYGPKLAQVALTVGADDVDSVSPVDDTGEGRRRGPLEEIRRNITQAGFVPIERDGVRKRVTT